MHELTECRKLLDIPNGEGRLVLHDSVQDRSFPVHKRAGAYGKIVAVTVLAHDDYQMPALVFSKGSATYIACSAVDHEACQKKCDGCSLNPGRRTVNAADFTLRMERE